MLTPDEIKREYGKIEFLGDQGKQISDAINAAVERQCENIDPAYQLPLQISLDQFSHPGPRPTLRQMAVELCERIDRGEDLDKSLMCPMRIIQELINYLRGGEES